MREIADIQAVKDVEVTAGGPVKEDEDNDYETCYETSLSRPSSLASLPLALDRCSSADSFCPSASFDCEPPKVPITGISRRSTADDPFEFRRGRFLTWKSVNMWMKKKAPNRKLLDNVWGQAPERETTGIMGPSGAGKSSLLNILAGRVTSNATVTVSADVRLNGVVVNPCDRSLRKQIAFVAQEDSLHFASTPRECIQFSAKLRLARSMTEKQLEKITNRMLEELGLVECADTIVGGGLLKGISGGERKRTSVGVELVTKPTVVFLDEPTSGLDSFSALQMCRVLKNIAKAGASVLFTIHQPASEIFDSFDHLLLLHKGRVMYEGSVENVPEYFEVRGQPLPPKYNPADWVMIVAQTLEEKRLEADGFFPKGERHLAVTEASVDHEDGKEAKDKSSDTCTTVSYQDDGQHCSVATEISLLMRRELRSLYRDKSILGVRLFITTFVAVLIGIIFWQVGEADNSNWTYLNSHFGAAIAVLIAGMFAPAVPSLVVFAQERPVFLREYYTNHYRAISYFLSTLAMEMILIVTQITVLAITTYLMVGFQLPFYSNWFIIFSLAITCTAIAVLVGSSVTNAKMAMELLPMCFVPQFFFAGFFVAPELIPSWIRWLQWVMPLTYSVKLYVNQEFGVECDAVTCDELLEDLNVNSDNVWWYWLALAGLFVIFHSTALIVLVRKAAKFY